MDMENNPHDVFFRTFFSDLTSMQGLLELILPPEISRALDFTSLVVEQDSYLDKEGKGHFVDLAASVKLVGAASGTGSATQNRLRIYILYEHKSWRDERALLQLLRYKQQIWQSYAVASEKLCAKSDVKPAALPLSPILPILFYHGVKGRMPERFSELFPPGVPPALLPRQVEFHAVMYNLSTTPKDQITAARDATLQAALLSLKYAREDFDLLLDELCRLARTGGKLFLHSPRYGLIKLYILKAVPLTNDEVRQKIKLKVTDPVMQEDIMLSAAAMFKQEGLEEGRQEGLEKGRQETVERMLAKNLDRQLIAEITQLPLKEIERLAERQ